MIALKLAYRNLVGAGLRTWLNVIVLSFSFVVIIWNQGMLDGWNIEARRDTIEWDAGGGQYWHEAYDPYDPFTIEDSHAPIPPTLRTQIEAETATPILIAQASIYPDGRMQNVLLKGIDPAQHVLAIPADALAVDSEEIPAVIGTRMAHSTKLREGDCVTVRWRDANGTFDAADARIVRLMKTNVPTVDGGVMWVPLERLQSMMQLDGQASIVVTAKDSELQTAPAGWIERDTEYLLQEITNIIESKKSGSTIMYVLLLFLAMLAIFDTQVLSVFRRRKEIGTLIALGMTRGRVVRLFTIEGAMHGILAAIVAAVYGVPLLWLQATKGFAMPRAADSYGLTIAEKIYPVYGLGLIVSTTIIVMLTVTIVSFLPARRIARMEPTDALRGKVT